MGKSILIGGGIIILALGAVFFFVQTQDVGEEQEGVSPLEVIEGEEVMEATEHVVVYADSGFAPSEITIKKGDTITFRNESSRTTWPATDIHPQHTLYPESGIQKCFDGSDISAVFDACGDVQPGEEWVFVFKEAGTWEYHDHRRATEAGTIIVEE